MPGTTADIEKLKELNKLDIKIAEATATLDDSPIAAQIKQVREKKAAVKQKRDQVDKIFVKARADLQQISDKDSSIVEAQNKLQSEIESTSGDYRKVQDQTTKLAELKTQREEIDKKLADTEANYNKIAELKSQIDAAISKLSMQEDDLTKSFVASNAESNQALQAATAQRQALQSSIDPNVLRLYSRVLDHVGANCLSELGDGEGDVELDTCSVCRNRLSAGQASSAHKDAPFYKCPHCGRLLIIA